MQLLMLDQNHTPLILVTTFGGSPRVCHWFQTRWFLKIFLEWILLDLNWSFCETFLLNPTVSGSLRGGLLQYLSLGHAHSFSAISNHPRRRWKANQGERKGNVSYGGHEKGTRGCMLYNIWYLSDFKVLSHSTSLSCMWMILKSWVID